MEVRIRTTWEIEAQPLSEVPFDKASLDNVIPLLNRWGVSDEEGNSFDSDSQMYGQFRVTPQGAYFEIVLGDV